MIADIILFLGNHFITKPRTQCSKHCYCSLHGGGFQSTYLPLGKMAAVLRTIFSNTFSWIKNCILIKIPLIFVPKGPINTLRPKQNGRHFADDIFKWIFLNNDLWIPIKISLKFVPKDAINNIPFLVRIMAWRRSGDKPLSEPIMVSILTHICVTRPQWVNNNPALV